MDMTPNFPAELEEPTSAPAATAPAVPVLHDFQDHQRELTQLAEAKGCLYAISQPPLMLFLAVIALLLAVTGVYDLFLL
ncbi:hypothetical protein [Streptomyces sp. WMMB 714]|uniref:hypothetical protein n=1 Tax=Streptomyces sp. WMMB 714 TaxID=1286822 RepID=UPI0005F84055|nr:hypothetical protein [Streptomyces sp. WMMB 714]